jgi:predicted NUDIX family NTP pyrophosphohydrolase
MRVTMAKKVSAGILLYRRRGDVLEVFLVHPGGPFWAKKDLGVWSLPKGEIGEGEDALAAAQREFTEETSFTASPPFRFLGELRQKSGKVIHAWAAEGDCDPSQMRSNLFTLEFPPRSGKFQEFPEADRGGWFSIEEARETIHPGQAEFLERLLKEA